MRTAIEIRRQVNDHVAQYQEATGVGPCMAVSYVLRERGYGPIAVAYCAPPGTEVGDFCRGFPHYVNIQPGGTIFDGSNPFEGCRYWDIEALGDDEWPDLISEIDVQWWRARLPDEED